MPRRPRSETPVPAPLTVAASLVAVQGIVLVLLAAAELANLSSQRVTMGVTTTAFFLLCGVGLLVCAWGLRRLATWARSPALLAQLIQLGVAWSFRGEPTTLLAIGLAVTALIVIAGLLHPASTEALVDDPTLERP